MKQAIFTGFSNEPRTIDSLSFPDYEPFGIQDMMDNYSGATRLLYRYSRENPRPYGIVTARNCPFSCSFCLEHDKKGKYQPRSMEKIMEEIKISYEKYKFNILIILDELFAVNKERMMQFCNGVMAGKELFGWDFDWMFQTHASAKLDLPTLEFAKKAGCVSFSYGLESASPTVLESMHKKIDPLDVVEAIKMAGQAGVGFSANLIFGDIAETSDTIVESVSFWLNHTREAFVFLGTVVPYPGSELFESARKKGLFPDKKAYYEHIHELNVNLTTMPDREWFIMQQAFNYLENSWTFVKTTPVIRIEQVKRENKLLLATGGFYYRFTANCPYCKAEINYVQNIKDINQSFFIGAGCTKCNKKIKVCKG